MAIRTGQNAFLLRPNNMHSASHGLLYRGMGSRAELTNFSQMDYHGKVFQFAGSRRMRMLKSNKIGY
jgi:hypothetical protein